MKLAYCAGWAIASLILDEQSIAPSVPRWMGDRLCCNGGWAIASLGHRELVFIDK